jgi:hypothetical protein
VIVDEIWSLLGPRRFLAGVVEQSVGGNSLVVFAPKYLLPSIVIQIRSELRQQERRVETLDELVAPDESLASSVPANDGLVSVFDQLGASGARTMIVTANTQSQFDSWSIALRRFHHHTLKLDALNRPTIIVVSELQGFAVAEEVALKVRHWKHVWGEIDSMALGDMFLFKEGPQATVDRIINHSISRLALWDAELAKSLAERPIEVLKNPIPLLIRTGEKCGWNPSSVDNEGDGSAGHENGRRIVHSSLLALRLDAAEVLTGGKDELWRRRWQGQAVVLLPWIEEQRQKLLKRIARFIRMPAGELEILEIGPLCFELARTNAPIVEKRKAALLREARNRLAHGLILSQAELVEVTRLCD